MLTFENLPSMYSDALSRIGKPNIPLEIVPSDSHPHQNKTPAQMKQQQLLHNQNLNTHMSSSPLKETCSNPALILLHTAFTTPEGVIPLL
jgi:hypothetical protein